MDQTMQRAETDRLWQIIEMLNWVLNEILQVNGTNIRKNPIECHSIKIRTGALSSTTFIIYFINP